MCVVRGVAPMTLEMLHLMRLVHKVKIFWAIEYHVTLKDNSLVINTAAPVSTSAPEPPPTISSQPHSRPPLAIFKPIFYLSVEFQ